MSNTKKKKKMHDLKVEKYVLFGRHREDLILRDRLSGSTCSEEIGEYSGYIEVYAKKGSWNIKRLLLIREKWHLK